MKRAFRYGMLRVLIFLAPLLALLGCSGKPKTTLPPPPAETVIAKVAVPVACEIEQPPIPDYPARLARPGDDLFTLAKIASADRRVRMAETERLRAAIHNPCPEINR